MYIVGDRVVLKTFNGLKEADEAVEDEENYWILIGEEGQIVQSPLEKGIYASFSQQKRLLVKFNKDITESRLACHNEVKNSLWILESDLEK